MKIGAIKYRFNDLCTILLYILHHSYTGLITWFKWNIPRAAGMSYLWQGQNTPISVIAPVKSRTNSYLLSFARFVKSLSSATSWQLPSLFFICMPPPSTCIWKTPVYALCVHLICSGIKTCGKELEFKWSLSSVTQSCLTLRPHESQHTRPPCPSPTPGVHSDSRPSSQWCHPVISSSVIPFSSCPQSLPASESFPVSQFFA